MLLWVKYFLWKLVIEVEVKNLKMDKNSLSINELKEAFFSLKTNKSPGYDDINLNVVKKCFGEIN